MTSCTEECDTLTQGIDLFRSLRDALVALGEFEQGFDFLRQAEKLAETLGDQRRLGQILAPMTHALWARGDYDNAITYGERALALTVASGDIVHQAMVRGCLGTVYFYLGDYHRAMDVLRRAMTSFEGALRHERFGGMMLSSVRVRTWLVDCLRELGDFAEGIACGEEALRIAEAAGHLGNAIRAQQKLGELTLRQGDLPRALSVLEYVFARVHAAHVPLFVPGITSSLGLAYALVGRSVEALSLLDQVEIREETPGMGSSHTMLRLSEAYRLADWLEDALRLADRTLTIARGRKERGNQAWALWLLGEVALRREPPEVEQGETQYRQALSLANELAMRPLQAHCHLGLGTLYAKTVQREQARTELTAAIDLYRAMDMTFWLTQAEAALAQAEGV